MIGKFQRIADQIEQDLPDFAGIGFDRVASIEPTPHGDVEPACMCARREKLDHFAGERTWPEVTFGKLNRAGIQPGKIEDIIEQIQQAFTGISDRIGIFALRRIKLCFEQKRHCPEDPV